MMKLEVAKVGMMNQAKMTKKPLLLGKNQSAPRPLEDILGLPLVLVLVVAVVAVALLALPVLGPVPKVRVLLYGPRTCLAHLKITKTKNIYTR